MDFEQLRQYRNKNNAFARKLGIVVEEIAPGYARASKTVLPDETNPAQTTHGGVYFTLADVTSGAASSSHGFVSTTVSADYHYLRSCHAGDTLTAVATEIKKGRTLCIYKVDITDQNGVLLGTGTYTYFIKDKLLDLETSEQSAEEGSHE